MKHLTENFDQKNLISILRMCSKKINFKETISC